MPRYDPYPAPESIKPLKFWGRDAPHVNQVISNLMFATAYQERAPMTIAYLVPQEVVLHTGRRTPPPYVARAWVLRPWQTRLLGIEVPDKAEKTWSGGTFMGTPEHFLVEHWEDCGSDGHTGFELVGYALLDEKQFDGMVEPGLTLVRPIWRP